MMGSQVPDSLDPHDVARAAKATGAASMIDILAEADLTVTANRWLPGDLFELSPSPYTLSGLMFVTDARGKRIYL